MSDPKETTIERMENDVCHVYTSELKFVHKLQQLKEEYPDEVEYKEVEPNVVMAKVPYNWMKFVGPKKKMHITAERKAQMSANIKKAREARFKKDDTDD